MSLLERRDMSRVHDLGNPFTPEDRSYRARKREKVASGAIPINDYIIRELHLKGKTWVQIAIYFGGGVTKFEIRDRLRAMGFTYHRRDESKREPASGQG